MFGCFKNRQPWWCPNGSVCLLRRGVSSRAGPHRLQQLCIAQGWDIVLSHGSPKARSRWEAPKCEDLQLCRPGNPPTHAADFDYSFVNDTPSRRFQNTFGTTAKSSRADSHTKFKHQTWRTLVISPSFGAGYYFVLHILVAFGAASLRIIGPIMATLNTGTLFHASRGVRGFDSARLVWNSYLVIERDNLYVASAQSFAQQVLWIC